MKNFSIRSALCAGLLVCAAAAAARGKKEGKAWIQNPYAGLDQKEFVAAVGQGRTSGEADKNAMAEVTHILSQTIQAKESFSQQATSTTDEQSYLASVTAVSAMKNLSGLSVTDRAVIDGAKFFSRATLNKRDAARHYSLLYNDNESSVNTIIERFKSKGASFEKCAALTRAYKIAKENDEYAALLSSLNSGIKKIPLYENSEGVRALAQDSFDALSAGIEVAGDSGGRLRYAFADVIHKTGIATTGGGGEAFRLSAEFSAEDAGRTDETVFARYSLRAILVSTADGKELLSFSASGRKGKLTEREAEQAALRDAESKIREEFAPKFFALFDTEIE